MRFSSESVPSNFVYLTRTLFYAYSDHACFTVPLQLPCFCMSVVMLDGLRVVNSRSFAY